MIRLEVQTRLRSVIHGAAAEHKQTERRSSFGTAPLISSLGAALALAAVWPRAVEVGGGGERSPEGAALARCWNDGVPPQLFGLSAFLTNELWSSVLAPAARRLLTAPRPERHLARSAAARRRLSSEPFHPDVPLFQ